MNKVGYDVIKVNVHSDSKAKKISPVIVGNYIVDMPGNNPLSCNSGYFFKNRFLAQKVVEVTANMWIGFITCFRGMKFYRKYRFHQFSVPKKIR